MGEEIRGKVHYSSVPGMSPIAALAKVLEQKDALHAGRLTPPRPEALTVKDLVINS